MTKHDHDHHAHARAQGGAHGHAHADAHRHGGSTRVLGVAVALTFGYALIEVVGGLWSGSLALLADAGHMVTDSAALLFALAASIIARRPASGRHSFGLARVEVIAAFVNALTMLAVVGWIFYEAFQRITDPVPVKGLEVLGIATVGLLVNVAVAWALSRDQHNINTRAALLHVLGDLLGSVAAIAAGLIIYLGGPTLVDPLLSMLIGGLILRSTIAVLRDSTAVLLDSVPQGMDLAAIGQALAKVPGIVSVHDLHVWTMTADTPSLSAHVLVQDIGHWSVVLHRARKLLKEQFGIAHVTLQPEWLRNDAPAQHIAVKPHNG